MILAEEAEMSEAAIPGIYRITTLIHDHAQAVHHGIEKATGLLREVEPALTVVSR